MKNKAVTDQIIKEIDGCLRRLFPICRSITGNGNRETLRALQEIIPLKILEYPSGRHVYDWVIPREWNIRDAWIKNTRGEKIVDFQKSNLHVVSYSSPVYQKLSFEELKGRLYYREDLPAAIPYRTSYYKEDWGFCLSYEDYQKYFNENGEYEVFIDSEFSDGSLTVGELLIPGKSAREYLISTYFCHPSLANDNLSGVVLTAFLARELLKQKNNFSYRIVFIPETIGAIAYCAENEDIMKSIDCGFVVTCVGGPGKFGYKQSLDPGHYINKAVESAFREVGEDFICYPFDIHGSDERQYSSPGFRINTASICRDKYYEYDYYHTSLDNLAFVSERHIDSTLSIYSRAVEILEQNVFYERTNPFCEVMLSKHDLYPKTGGGLLPNAGGLGSLDNILWFLFLCDGKTSLSEIACKMNVEMETLVPLTDLFVEKGIIRQA